MSPTRRRVLVWAGAAVGLAGCVDDGSEATASATEVQTAASDATPTRTATGTPATEPTTTVPDEPAVPLADLNDAVAERDADIVTLDLRPTDPAADYAASEVFAASDGTLPVAVDLETALERRHYDHPLTERPAVREFVEHAGDPDWRERLHEDYLFANGGENAHGLQPAVDWERYLEGLTFRERIAVSGVQDLWFKYCDVGEHGPGIDDANNHLQAAAYQTLERRHGHATFVWDHPAYGPDGERGLVAAVEHPTRDPAAAADQEAFVVECVPDRTAVARVSESKYFESGRRAAGKVLHPAASEYGDVAGDRTMYRRTALERDEDALSVRVNQVDRSLTRPFAGEWFRDPTTRPAFDYLDRMAVAAHVASEAGGQVHHGADTVEYNAPG